MGRKATKKAAIGVGTPLAAMNQGHDSPAIITQVESKFLKAKEIAAIIRGSESQAYKTIKAVNEQLAAQGKIVFPGKVLRRAFYEAVGLDERGE